MHVCSTGHSEERSTECMCVVQDTVRREVQNVCVQYRTQ